MPHSVCNCVEYRCPSLGVPGYQRPLDQTELSGFAYWEMKNPVEVRIDCEAEVTRAIVRPSVFGITPRINGSRITFSLRSPGIIKPKSGEFVYVDAGAVVYGGILCEDVSDVTISGRGILDAVLPDCFEVDYVRVFDVE